jgi:hypothetical protein
MEKYTRVLTRLDGRGGAWRGEAMDAGARRACE